MIGLSSIVALRVYWIVLHLFDYERTWCRLCRKHAVLIKFDIYVYIIR